MNRGIGYPSLVNCVYRAGDGHLEMVRKEYGEVALRTGVPVPLERKVIEERMLDVLGRERFLGFKVPAVIGSGDRYLDLEVVQGLLAIDVIDFENVHGWVDRWCSVGEGLALAEEYLKVHSGYIFEGLHLVQEWCAQIMNGMKCDQAVGGAGGDCVWVSMGDVGVRNIIINESHTYLFDFEFAHLSRRARDAGQLCAQLVSLGHNKLAASVEAGYLGVSRSALNDLSFWKFAFSKYYGMKYGKN